LPDRAWNRLENVNLKCVDLPAARCGAGARLIAVTGYGQEQDRTRSVDAGFDAHLVKPIDLEALQTLIDEDTV
jgi:CheY-like chemotaxis protein